MAGTRCYGWLLEQTEKGYKETFWTQDAGNTYFILVVAVNI